MKLLKVSIALLFGLYLMVNPVFAAPSTGIGSVAQNMLSPVGLFSDFVYTGCIVIGGSFIFASIIKYMEHRRSPLMVPISTVVFLLVAGIVLLLLPFLAYINKNGIPYTLFG